MQNNTLSIIIPAYNESRTILEMLQKIQDLTIPGYKKEVIIIDDGSKDDTWKLIKSKLVEFQELKAFQNENNIGKTQTIKKGLQLSSGELVIIQDADLEYNPNEIPLLIDFLNQNKLDVVYGNRFGKKNKVIYLRHYLGNRALSIFSNLFTYPRIKTWISDMEVCYKLIKGNIAREIATKITSKSKFGLEPEITARLSRYKKNGQHLKFGNLPISYYPRTIAEGKKINAIRDGLKAFKEIIVYNLGRK